MPPRSFISRLALLSVIMILPLWGVIAFEWPISLDFIFYSNLTKLFSAQLWSGDLYPRWLSQANNGLGSPAMLFHGPLAYYAISLFQFLSPLDPHGFGRLLIDMSLALFVSGITSYRWFSRFFDKAASQRAALLYAGFPYLFIIIYNNFAAHQLWAIAFFPLALEGAQDLVEGSWKGLPKLSCAYALICLSHILCTLMFAAIPCAYILLLSPADKRLKCTAMAIASAVLGIGLSAFYLLPLLANAASFPTEHFISREHSYTMHFFDMQSLAGIFIVIAPLLGFFLELPNKKSMLSPIIYFWLAVIALLFFLTLPVSGFLWAHIAPLRYLQFPFRLFIGMLPGAVFIATYWRPQVKSQNLYLYFWPIGFCLIAATSLHYFFLPSPKHASEFIQYDQVPFSQADVPWKNLSGLEDVQDLPQEYLAMPALKVVNGNADAKITAQTTHRISVHANVTSPQATITLKQLYFPNWVSDTPDVTVAEQEGLITMNMPKGEHDINIRLSDFAGQKTGELISLVSVIILLGFVAVNKNRRTA